MTTERKKSSLEAARAKAGVERVTWIEGTSPVLADAWFEVAVMTSHVAQFFVDDEWRRTLADLKRTLVPGGTLQGASASMRSDAGRR